MVIAVDSTGVSVHKAGGWVEREHGKKKMVQKWKDVRRLIVY